MNRRSILMWWILVICCGMMFVPSRALHAEVVTYQGRLTDNGAAATGTFDLTYQFFSDSAGTLSVSPVGCADAVETVDGLFTAELNVSPGTFNGDERWLKLSVRRDDTDTSDCSDLAGFTALSPLRRVSSAPQAINADRLDDLDSADFLLTEDFDNNGDGNIDGGALSISSLDAGDGSPTRIVNVDADGELVIGGFAAQSMLHLKEFSGFPPMITYDFGSTASGNLLRIPAAAVEDSASPANPWTGETSVFASDDVDASVTFTAVSASNNLVLTNFFFSIPFDARIVGIELLVEKSSSGPVRDQVIQLLGANQTPESKGESAFWPAGDSVFTYGGTADTWDVGWTPQMINSNAFGVRIAATTTTIGSVARIDHVQIRVHYSPGFVSAGSDVSGTGFQVVDGAGTGNVLMTMTRSGLLQIPTDNSVGMTLTHSGGNSMLIGRDRSNTSPLVITAGTSAGVANPALSVVTSNRVGIGINNPQEDLSVGNAAADPKLQIRKDGTDAANLGFETADSVFRITAASFATNAPWFALLNSQSIGVFHDAPLVPLHARKSVAAGTTLANHLALLDNPNTVAGSDVLALRVGQTTSPTTANNYITFYYNGTTSAGAIEGNGGGAVQLGGAGADYAEWMKRRDLAEVIESGDVVGIYEDGISRRTDGAERVMVVSSGPIVLGNKPSDAEENTGHPVAFIGQAPVRVLGPVVAGQVLLASGRNDGTAVARNAADLQHHDLARAVGVAWQGNHETGEHLVNAAIGLGINQAGIIERMQQNHVALQQQVSELERRLNLLTERVGLLDLDIAVRE